MICNVCTRTLGNGSSTGDAGQDTSTLSSQPHENGDRALSSIVAFDLELKLVRYVNSRQQKPSVSLCSSYPSIPVERFNQPPNLLDPWGFLAALVRMDEEEENALNRQSADTDWTRLEWGSIMGRSWT